jgi:hypothetical protein
MEQAMGRYSGSLGLVGFLTAAAICGCSTTASGVVPIGNGTYRLGLTRVGSTTQATTNINTLIAANDYCDKLGKHLVYQRAADSGSHRVSVRQYDVVFSCLDANDPAYTRTHRQGNSAVVANNQ